MDPQGHRSQQPAGLRQQAWPSQTLFFRPAHLAPETSCTAAFTAQVSLPHFPTCSLRGTQPKPASTPLSEQSPRTIKTVFPKKKKKTKKTVFPGYATGCQLLGQYLETNVVRTINEKSKRSPVKAATPDHSENQQETGTTGLTRSHGSKDAEEFQH